MMKVLINLSVYSPFSSHQTYLGRTKKEKEKDMWKISNDRDLIHAYRSGEHFALLVLFDRYSHKIAAGARTFALNDYDVQDIIQEVYLKIQESFHRNNEYHTLGTWFYTVARNASYDWMLRKNRKHNQSASLDFLLERGWLSEQIIYPLGDSLYRDEIRALIRSIPEKFRLCLVLTEILGLSIKETASLLDTNTGTVKSRTYRAKQLLKEEYICKGFANIENM